MAQEALAELSVTRLNFTAEPGDEFEELIILLNSVKWEYPAVTIYDGDGNKYYRKIDWFLGLAIPSSTPGDSDASENEAMEG